jgi:transcriptional regulator with XRE-family HTH domain
MESSEFKEFRAKLNKTQAQMAQLLGVSLKAVHSYEQGWRSVPAAVERQMYFLVVKQNTQKDQWNHLRRYGSKKLERKNEDLQDLRSIWAPDPISFLHKP